ncbi:DMT family transporter [Candidatus Amarobacter glycogenicus]|uniref:DMT family transporter n=1 Tax=Candidatus Amarobacter glycogenicus TaxID=3140699 RepID=UPI00313727A8|nr:DMT family transporter [Dehalococcoidia bacterium]
MGSGELASLIAAMIWACTSVALTSLSARTSPVVLSGLRLAFGSVVVAIVLLVSGQAGGLRDASNGTLAGVILSGLIGYGLGDTVYIVALKRVGMQRTFPITMALFIGLTVIGGVVLLGEDLSWGLPAGALFIGSGVYFLVVPANDATPHATPPLPVEPAAATLAESRSLAVAASPDAMGYALLVAVGILWTIATLWLANARGDLEPIAAGAIRTPAGATALLGFAMATQRPSLAAPFRNRNHLAAIVAAGAVGTGLGSLLYVYGVLEAGAAQAAVLSATSPLMALPLSIVFLGERFTPKVGLGTVLCVGGIVLVVLG